MQADDRDIDESDSDDGWDESRPHDEAAQETTNERD